MALPRCGACAGAAPPEGREAQRVITCLPDVLSPAERETIVKLVAEASFVPGRATAMGPAVQMRRHSHFVR